jgi:transposase
MWKVDHSSLELRLKHKKGGNHLQVDSRSKKIGGQLNPPKSPDLNPIENTWVWMAEEVYFDKLGMKMWMSWERPFSMRGR